ncbi:MAG: SDR family NAD(P)-dependent oxidoreductase [Acidobacteria bacterium]|nr:MAG: SDR family NAD(P)-dependent oxidoreductase [Acidobacteriota bacterium]
MSDTSESVRSSSAPRVVLVTGGGRGIGRAVVEMLADRGCRVALTYRSDAAAAEAVCDGREGQVRAFEWDAADRGAAKRLVGEVEDRVGEIDGLVNNAGIAHSGLLAMTSDEQWDRVLDVNLGGVFRLCRAVVPLMVRRRRGAVVNLSSLAALRGVAGPAAYAASKAGVLALTRSLAREIGSRGVRVNAVVPGFVATDMTSTLPERVISVLRAAESLPRGVDARQVAATVCFLLSEDAGAITGQCVPVDAGASA